ncbi:Glycosaminoglycan attachment site [Fulvivirga imtechensis AK7]|uniref:Glycosaminoglycan attachment site n=1 Tax=Fulvivirga imtechensis AK7 TaxID=1237149 RepID=L8JWX7_9BACT|nr:hypothetical protein [Fulvivirga imtechensis]ELR71707.1 Glycosaminoglycan attachment site [Fulvivirga imtechensis AK7]
MKNAYPISKKLFDIFALFTREPFVQFYTKELEFYSNGNGVLLGLISMDLIDGDYYTCILSRDSSRQYRAESVEGNIPTIEQARSWIDTKMGSDAITYHENVEYFDVFKGRTSEKQTHPNYKLLKESESFSSAREVIKEVSYHYKDIDGNFIDQFQSINGFDARVWELYLFCFFREQYFSFERNHEAPDYLVEKFGPKIAIEAVIVSRKTALSKVLEHKSSEEIQEALSNDVPLMYGSALFSKVKKEYWKRDHVQNMPFVIAIADFHDDFSMTWSFGALSEYLYGYKYSSSFDDDGKLLIEPVQVEGYKKRNGTIVPSGFFFQPGSENVSAVIFSSCATLSKFNRIGKQAGLGSGNVELIRTISYHDHDPNASEPALLSYKVCEASDESWSEGIIIYHNPNANILLNPDLFDERVAQAFFQNGFIKSVMPEVFPYSSSTLNLIVKE